MSEQPQPTTSDEYACKVCGNTPGEDGRLEHGDGCYTQSEDGGGSEYIEEADMSRNKPTADQSPSGRDLSDHKYLDAVCALDGCQSLVYRHQAEVYRVAMVESVAQIGEWSRKCGEAEGKLLASETAGVSSGWQQRAEAAEAKLADARQRLAKVREALTRLDKWAELSPFAEDILAEAQAALAEGEAKDE